MGCMNSARGLGNSVPLVVNPNLDSIRAAVNSTDFAPPTL